VNSSRAREGGVTAISDCERHDHRALTMALSER
jgi:hypothetical protein